MMFYSFLLLHWTDNCCNFVDISIFKKLFIEGVRVYGFRMLGIGAGVEVMALW